MKAQGKLLIIGGAEDIGEEETPEIKRKNKEFAPFEILYELMNNSKNKKVEIITTGSEVPEEVKEKYLSAFARMGSFVPSFLHIRNKMEARDPEYLARIEKTGAIFFTGGDQFRLSTILSGTPTIDLIKKRYVAEPDFLVAGTSAGAMVMSEVMIAEGGIEEALIYRNVKTSSGLGFLRYCIIDTHFIKRGRFGRLAHAIIINPEKLGIGLGEDTALIIKNGNEAECRGSGMVVIIDGMEMQQSNITIATEGEPVYVENLKVHILVKGCRFLLRKRKLFSSLTYGESNE